MVMTAPSKMVIWVMNDRTTKGVAAVWGTARDEGSQGRGACVCVAR